MAINVPWLDDPLSCGDMHGAPVIHSPPAKIHRRHFFGNEGELEIVGGKMGRPIVLNAILNDSTWTKPWHVYNYLKIGVEAGISVNGIVEVTFPDSTKATFHGCTFEKYELIPQPGHQMAAPLKDFTTQLNGTVDTWWIEVNLHFHQLQVGNANSTFSAS